VEVLGDRMSAVKGGVLGEFLSYPHQNDVLMVVVFITHGHPYLCPLCFALRTRYSLSLLQT